MNIFLIVISCVILVVVVLLAIALLIKGDYEIEREAIIDRPRTAVFDYIKLIKNQEYYSYWVMQDPTNKITYHGTDGTVGFISKWEGEKKAGKGAQEIVDLVEGSAVRIEIRFEKPFKNVAHTLMTISEIGSKQTLVKWSMKGNNKFPFTLFNLVIDGVLGKDMEKSLANLKHILAEQRKTA
jgi:uncharacterized protein YndB with AHSA1/START domain